jgi:tetratricopeptide (TPR) repeat protein
VCKPAPSAADAFESKADALFEANEYSSLVDILREELRRRPQDARVLWRLARALKKVSDVAPKATKEGVVREALELAGRALAVDTHSGPAHKWYAILLSESGSFGSTSDKIKNSFVVRTHFELAIRHSPKDATARHLLGLWCFEVAKLSWIEQKAAAALFAAPPKATFEEAISHFAAAEDMEPSFYPKNQLLLAQACARVGRKDEAREWLTRCLGSVACTPEDQETLREAAKLKI